MEEEERSKKKAKREQSSGPAAVKAHPAPENSREWVRHRAGLTLDCVNPRHSKAYELRAHLRDIAENIATRSILEEENGAIKVKCFVCPIMMSVTNWSNYEQHLRSQHKDKDKDNKEVPLLIEKKRPASPVARESSSSQSTTLSGESEAPLGQLLSDMATTLSDLSDSQVAALSPSSAAATAIAAAPKLIGASHVMAGPPEHLVYSAPPLSLPTVFECVLLSCHCILS